MITSPFLLLFLSQLLVTESTHALKTASHIPSFSDQKNIKNTKLKPKTLWEQNRIHSAIDLNKKQIVIVIDDMGLRPYREKELLQMDIPLTLAYFPFAPKVKEQMKEARQLNHELLLHMPMQPKSAKQQPGKNHLNIDLSEEQFNQNLNWAFHQTDYIVGLNNHMGSRLTADLTSMNRLMRELKERELIFLDSKTTPHSVSHIAAHKYETPHLSRDVFLDHIDDTVEIKKAFQKLEKIASVKGYAIAIGHPRIKTITELKKWLSTYDNNKFQIISLATLYSHIKSLKE